MRWKSPLEVIGFKKKAYQLTFGHDPGKVVLQDLAKFCRANETCFERSERVGWMLEGRREVWLRIARYLKLKPEEIMLYLGMSLHEDENEGVE